MGLRVRVLGLVIGFAAKFVTGSLFVFNVYQEAIKDTFNYTQKEMEVLPSLLNVGLGVGFVPGYMFDRFGPKWTSVAGLAVSVSAYLLLWSTTKSVKFYSKNSWLMAIYFFFCGFGSVFTYMVALNTNIINFDRKHTGKIVGFLNAFFAGSPSIFSVIYYNTYGKEDDPSSAFSGFMLMFAILFAVADLLCVAFLRIENQPAVTVSPESLAPTDTRGSAPTVVTGSTEERVDKAMGSPAEDTAVTKHVSLDSPDPYRHVPLSLKEILCKVDFYIFVCLFAFVSSIGLVFVNNLTTISDSMSYGDRYDNRLTVIIPIVNAILSAFIGWFSDAFREKIPKMWLVNFAVVSFIMSQILVLFWANFIAVLMTATVLVGVGIGIIWSLFPTIAQDMFYIGNIGRNWGIAILVASALGFCAQTVFGVFYDHEIMTPNTTHCEGMRCIRGGTIMTTAFGVISLILGIIAHIKREWRIRKLRQYQRY